MGLRQRTGIDDVPSYDYSEQSLFSLMIRHGGWLKHNEPVAYLGGKTDFFDYMNVDLWGFITLNEKVEELGYNLTETKFYSVVEDGLIEIISDREAWDLLDFEGKQREVEIWVVVWGLCAQFEEEVNDIANGTDGDNNDIDLDYNLQGFLENDNELTRDRDDDIDFDKYVDPNVEYFGVDSIDIVHEGEGCNNNFNVEVNYFDEGTPRGSDEEVEVDIFPQFCANTDMNSPTFCIGMTFGTKHDFKEAIYNYAFNHGKDLKFEKNDKIRCVAKCKESGCPWSITLRWIQDENCWRITSFKDLHDGCSWANDNKMINSRTLAKRWKNEIKNHSDWKLSEFREKVYTDEKFTVSTRQAYMAISLARSEIKGDLEDYFKKFWSYFFEIQRTNPNTTSIVQLSDFVDESEKKRFQRWYICWEACRDGFKHCRQIIGVDGCHLKANYGGHFLTATGMDPKDDIFPIAYAIVEGENKESWTWFLQLLKHDLGITEVSQHYITFISYKQKGLIPAFHNVLPNVSHRFCVRHLYANLGVAGFQGKAIKEALWAAARATTVNDFTAALRHLKGLDIKAFEWLVDKHPSEWSRSHFNDYAYCDALVNNISECFNSMILDARENPVISCLEILRKIVMTRLFKCKQQATKWNGPLCPNI